MEGHSVKEHVHAAVQRATVELHVEVSALHSKYIASGPKSV